MINTYIYLAVIIGGASVLAIELLGTRIIAPYYGASIYLWSALISITLAALSFGYAVGGRLVDRGAKLTHFNVLIGSAGLWIVFIPLLQSPVMALAESMELRIAVLFISMIMFFPPLALLGMVSPYAIRLKASSLDVVGRTAGNLYAVSTLASVFAAIAIGFFLIPNIGVTRLIFIIGILLITTALIGFVVEHKHKAVKIAVILIIAGVLGSQVTPSNLVDPMKGLIAIEQSAYAEIRIVDMDDIRYMFIDGSMHTSADTSTWESYFEYVNVLEIPKLLFKKPGEMLLVGLGGGSIVKNYFRDGWQVDAVEIDPVVTSLAKEYFGLKDEEAQIFEMDGRQFLNTQNKTYDIIIMDAFGSSSIPFHLVTEESFAAIRSRLTTEGILAMNIHAIGWKDEIVTSLVATASGEFKNVLVLPIAEPPDKLGNIILLASNHDLELIEELPQPLDRFSAEYDRKHAWDNQFEVDVTGITKLTDDLNPIDVWTERVNLASRKELHKNLGDTRIAW